MIKCCARRLAAFLIATPILCTLSLPAQQTAGAANSAEQLQFVVFLSRHGVRSPTGNPDKYSAYSAAPWPKWSVPPGYLTAHGFELMRLFGAYDRAKLADEGLLAANGCADAGRVTILADSDQRTRETGKALAEGMFPGCAPGVHARPEGDQDPLFHSMKAGVGKPDRALATAAIEGRIGGKASNLTEVYRPQLEALDRILAGCGRVAANPKRTSIFDASTEAALSAEGHGDELRGPVTVASSMTESLLLEYAEGMKGADLSWGCLDEAGLREIVQLHTANTDYTERTPLIARMDASNLLVHILDALEQSSTGKIVAGAPGKPGDRALFLVGHDTNIATVAGALDLDWITDGRRDDTPPGGALIFELWRAPTGAYSVRVYYTAQTLDQMRETQPLTLANPPQRAPVFVPGCSAKTMACTLEGFAATVRKAVDPAYVSGQPEQ